MLSSLALVACHAPERSRLIPHRARVRSFTEATSVRRLVSAPPYVFAATARGLDQWDLRSGERISLGPLAQFAERVLDLAYDSRRRVLWIVNADGVARYQLTTGVVTRLPPPPAGEPASAFVGAVVSPAPDGGVWLGLADGLYFADAEGAWQPTGVTGPIEALHLTAAGKLLVGTRSGLFSIRRGEPALPTSCPLERVRVIAQAPEGVLAIGESARGEQRVAYLRGEDCDAYRVSPSRRLRDAASDGERVLLLTASGLYELAAPRPGPRVRRLSRDGMTLIPLEPRRAPGEPRLTRAPLDLRSVAAEVPAGAQTVAISGREVLVGTVSLGTARLDLDGGAAPKQGRGHGPRWLRRRELAASAVHLSVVCTGEGDCVLANGTGGSWDFDGERFSRRQGATPVLGVAEVRGRVLEVVARQGEPVIDVKDAGRPGAPPLASAPLVPGAELRLLRAGPGSSLLIGWGDAGAEPATPLSALAWIDIARGVERPLEIRSTAGGDPHRDPLVGESDGAVYDLVSCGERIFAATAAGVREVGGALRPVSGGPVLRLACDRGRLVAATRTQIFHEGPSWVEMVTLAEPIRDLAVSEDGRLFLATAGGVGIWDGVEVRRYDVRRGLIDNDVLEIVLDRFDRVWLRGRTGVGQIRL